MYFEKKICGLQKYFRNLLENDIYLTSRPAELSQILEKKTEAGIDNISQLLPRKIFGPSAVLAFYQT